MNVLQVFNFFKDKEHVPSPCTERLIKAGYQQESGGYIDCAKKQGIAIDHQQCQPSQYWHLINSYCEIKLHENKGAAAFTKRIQCGELILCMAETAQAISKEELDDLVNRIINSGEKCQRRKGSTKPCMKYSRRIWNKEIQKGHYNKDRKVVKIQNRRLHT